MEKYFVPFESGLSQEMDLLGFDEKCLAIYNKTQYATYGGDGELVPVGTLLMVTVDKNRINPDFIVAPLFCQAQTWLREKHNMNLEAYQADSGDYVYSLTSTGPNNQRLWQDGNWPYFEALTHGLAKAIELIKKRKQ